MIDATALTHPLEQLLREQLRHIATVTSYLESIRQSIAGNSIDQLEKLLNTGCASFTTLEELQQQQNSLLLSHGYAAGPQELTRCLNDIDSPALNTLGQSLLQKLEHLQKALFINELLIKKNQDRVRQSIRILNGRSDHAQGIRNTYSSNGITDQSDQDQRKLAIA